MSGPLFEKLADGRTVLAAEKVTKRFGELAANHSIDFDLRGGEIHALLGENGAGKTTLCNILYGLYRPDSGRILLKGREARFRTPKDAMDAGIGMVHQELMLVPTMTVTENVALMYDSRFQLVVDFGEVAKKVREISKTYGLSIRPDSKIRELSVGERQRVEIIKALLRGADILILDEPTSFLTKIESAELFKALRQMANAGKSIIFVSHKIDEVLVLSDRVTVLRQGRVLATVDTAKVVKQDLVRMIFGRDVLMTVGKSSISKGEVLVELKDVTVIGDSGLPALEKVSLTIRSGEIVGIAGVAGNGQRELADVICGLRRPIDGKIRLLGKEFAKVSSLEARKMGIAHIPEDQRMGLVFDFNLSDNILILPHTVKNFARRIPIIGHLINRKAVRERLQRLIGEYDIKAPGEDVPAWALSGGTKQKLIFSRELFWNPRMIVANNPTKGLDLAATEYVRNIMNMERERGKGILLISTDLDEIVDISDVIAVLSNGRIVGQFKKSEADLGAIATLMTMSKSA